MSLHNKIMNIQCDNRDTLGKDPMLTYKQGHRDARHAAAELALNADEEIERLRNALSKIANWELPETGRYWNDETKRPVSYEAEYGSRGVRIYIQNLAIEALKEQQ